VGEKEKKRKKKKNEGDEPERCFGGVLEMNQRERK
jgi:hypothetical protein